MRTQISIPSMLVPHVRAPQPHRRALYSGDQWQGYEEPLESHTVASRSHSWVSRLKEVDGGSRVVCVALGHEVGIAGIHGCHVTMQTGPPRVHTQLMNSIPSRWVDDLACDALMMPQIPASALALLRKYAVNINRNRSGIIIL